MLQEKPIGSWVLGDVDSNISTEFDSGSLTVKLSGTPYYFFWHEKLPSNTELIEALMQWRVHHPGTTRAEREAAVIEMTKSLSRLTPDTRFTDLIREKYGLLLQANRPVYTAASLLASSAALFRYVKQTNSDSWNPFVQQVQVISLDPTLRTPTRMPR
jgi:hypothetical protein